MLDYNIITTEIFKYSHSNFTSSILLCHDNLTVGQHGKVKGVAYLYDVLEVSWFTQEAVRACRLQLSI